MPQMSEEQIEQVAEKQTQANPANQIPQYTNDLSDADKETIVKYVNDNVKDILAQPALSTNNLCHIAQVSHGSIKSRGKLTSSAREIVMGVINGTRATRTPALNTTSVKSFIDSLPPEEKERMLKELLGNQSVPSPQ